MHYLLAHPDHALGHGKNAHILFLWKLKKKKKKLFTSDHSLFIADSFDMCKNYHNFL